MTSDNAGLQVTTKDDSDVLVEISLDGATWQIAAFNHRGVKNVVDVISGGKAGLKPSNKYPTTKDTWLLMEWMTR